MDLTGVLWICGRGRLGVADEVAERLGLAVRHVVLSDYRAFRDLLHELRRLDAQRLVVAGELPVPAVAAVGGNAVFVGDDRDARILRIPCLSADASADEVIAAVDRSP